MSFKGNNTLAHRNTSIPQSRQPVAVPQVTLSDVYRYQYHYGVNLGGIFVLEKWLFGGMFDDNADEEANGDSEVDAVITYVMIY